MEYIGIDIHRKFSFVHVMDEKGQSKECRRLEHDDIGDLRDFFKDYEGSSAAVEATVGWMWLADELESLGIDVHLAHSLGVRLIAESRLKTDKVDAKVLANLLRTNFLPEAYLAPQDVRREREILRYRMSLVKARTSAKNRVHALFTRLNMMFEATDIFGTKTREELYKLEIEEPYRTILRGWLDFIGFLDGQIGEMDKWALKTLKKDERFKNLITMPGIGPVLAWTILAEVGEIKRFLSVRAFASYCGLAPSTHQSGDVRYNGGIGNACRRTLRWAFIEASHTAVRRDSYFTTLFNKHKKKGTGKAMVIAAHQMASIVYDMLKNERGYIPRPKQRPKTNRVGPRLTMAD